MEFFSSRILFLLTFYVCVTSLDFCLRNFALYSFTDWFSKNIFQGNIKERVEESLFLFLSLNSPRWFSLFCFHGLLPSSKMELWIQIFRPNSQQRRHWNPWPNSGHKVSAARGSKHPALLLYSPSKLAAMAAGFSCEDNNITTMRIPEHTARKKLKAEPASVRTLKLSPARYKAGIVQWRN